MKKTLAIFAFITVIAATQGFAQNTAPVANPAPSNPAPSNAAPSNPAPVNAPAANNNQPVNTPAAGSTTTNTTIDSDVNSNTPVNTTPAAKELNQQKEDAASDPQSTSQTDQTGSAAMRAYKAEQRVQARKNRSTLRQQNNNVTPTTTTPTNAAPAATTPAK